MSSHKTSRKLGVAKRRELEVSAALAREAVTQFHVNSALSLIELAADRVSAVRMLDIYLRMHGIVGPEAELLSYSVLAALGHRASKGTTASLFVEGEEPAPLEQASLLKLLKVRLKGRVHHDLRRWVELATGATQAGLVDIHVRHAVRFARELGDSHSIAQAAELYAEMAGVPVILRDMLYIYLLERLAAEELPRRNQTTAPQTDRVSLFPHRPRRAV
ncbi:MAG TPA: hypothetical protein VFZ24_03230 [Longimicrobiales bacterium]